MPSAFSTAAYSKTVRQYGDTMQRRHGVFCQALQVVRTGRLRLSRRCEKWGLSATWSRGYAGQGEKPPQAPGRFFYLPWWKVFFA
jgi:hypothetical protein